jgi:hypothetical protein
VARDKAVARRRSAGSDRPFGLGLDAVARGAMSAPPPGTDRRFIVAKGQKKSNREIRKPKTAKAKPTSAAKSSFLTPPPKTKK